MTFLERLPRPFLVLAPMDDVTDTVFRQIIATLPYPMHADGVQGAGEQRTELYKGGTAKEQPQPATLQSAASTSGAAGSASRQAGAVRGYGPDLYFTEFVNVDGLQSPGREKLLPKLRFSEKERPIIAQLWGIKPENFYKTTKEIIDMGFDGVDLNFGCPVKKIVKGGACAALINNRELAGEIIEATREAAGRDFPVSVKTRVGFTTVDLSWLEFLLSKKLDLLSIHGRTAKQLSNFPADWQLIGKVREMRDVLCPTTFIIGNGDVDSRAQAEELAKKYKLDGVMVGRGVFHDPFIFASKSPWGSYTKEQKIELFRKHIELFTDTWKHGEYRFDSLKKFCKVYINGFDGASDVRAQFMQTSSPREAIEIIENA
jgi:tRNA-dihydrouridine synthase